MPTGFGHVLIGLELKENVWTWENGKPFDWNLQPQPWVENHPARETSIGSIVFHTAKEGLYTFPDGSPGLNLCMMNETKAIVHE